MKELTKLDEPVTRRTARAVDGLAVQPATYGPRALIGYAGLWRTRIGDYPGVDRKTLVMTRVRGNVLVPAKSPGDPEHCS